MRKFAFSVFLLSFAPLMVFADQTVFQCAGNNLEIVKKIVSGDRGYRREVGLFLVVFGDLAKELQQKKLYPTDMVPGSNTEGLYWSEAVQFREGDYGANVRIANVKGPFLNYYLKSTNSRDAILEIWQTSGYRSVKDGVGSNANLVYSKRFSDCR